MAKIKTLCLCAGGVVRSVTLANLLKVYWKQDALAAGFMNTDKTLEYLMEWADHIYVLEEWMFSKVPEQYRYKTRVLDVGPDIWGMSNHPDLIRLCHRLLEQDIGPDRRTEPLEVVMARREAVMAERQQVVSTYVDRPVFSD